MIGSPASIRHTESLATPWYALPLPLSKQPLSCRRDIVSPSLCRIESAAMTARRRGLAAISEKSLGTWEHGNIFFSRFLNFPDFPLISLFQKWRQFAFSKAPPFDFFAKISDFLMPSRGCSRMPIMPIRNSQNQGWIPTMSGSNQMSIFDFLRPPIGDWLARYPL